MSKIEDLQGKLEAQRKDLHEIFEAAGPDIDLQKATQLEGDSTARAEQVRAKNDAMTATAKDLEAQQELEGMRKRTSALGEPDKRGRALAAQAGAPLEAMEKPLQTLGELFVDSPAYSAYKGGGIGPVATMEMPRRVGDMQATLFQTSAGYAPQSIRTGFVQPFATRPIQVIDLFPAGRTSQQAVVYMEETTFTNAAAETSEGGTYAESALALTEKTSTVRKIATFLPVTDEQLEDVDGIESYIDNRLTFMLRQRLDSQCLVGDGSSPNLRGILNVSGIQTQARGTDPGADAFYKAMTLVRVTGRANPSAAVVHPTNWQGIKLSRTTDGIYLWGNPADPGPDRIWGLQVALSDAITLNTALVGDFSMSSLVMRRDVDVQISNSHSTYFIEGKQAIRADLRVALVIYRPAAFATVTSLT